MLTQYKENAVLNKKTCEVASVLHLICHEFGCTLAVQKKSNKCIHIPKYKNCFKTLSPV